MIHGASSVEKEITASASVPEVPSKSGNDDRRFFAHHPELKKTFGVPFAQDDSCIPKNPQERNLRKASLSVASSLLC